MIRVGGYRDDVAHFRNSRERLLASLPRENFVLLSGFSFGFAGEDIKGDASKLGAIARQ